MASTLASYLAKTGLAKTGDDLTHESSGQTAWPSTAEIFFPGGRSFKTGEILVQKDLARSFMRLIEVERENSSQGREAAIQTARDFFYKGEIAQEMVRFNQENGGLLTMQDLADFHVGVETPAHGTYKAPVYQKVQRHPAKRKGPLRGTSSEHTPGRSGGGTETERRGPGP